MTAFGRKSLTAELGRFVIEIQSVNRKHLEINVMLPKEFMRFDVDMRNWISARVTRGQINVKVSIATTKESPLTVSPNLPLIRQYKAAWDQIQDELSLQADDGAFITLLNRDTGIFLNEENLKDEAAYHTALKLAVDQALDELMGMKLKEGAVLQKDLSSRVDKLGKWIAEIAAKAPGATQRYRQKLLERMIEVLENLSEVDERILKEVAIYAEKIDIAEEIVRFNSHLDQFVNLIGSESESIGKTLEFLIQELHREINTIASKSSDLEVSRLVIDCKSELERVREQIQNVE